jgi:hypothetical protein
MGQSSGTNSNREPPRERNKRRCYAEQAPKEPVAVEREFPAEANSPIERIQPHVRPLSALFENWGAP